MIASCPTDVCLGDLRSASAAQTGCRVVLFCCSDDEDEDPDIFLRASTRDPQCTARIATDPHPEPQRPVTHHRHTGNTSHPVRVVRYSGVTCDHLLSSILNRQELTCQSQTHYRNNISNT